ncbi:uncharacterized protein LOC144201987 isoform X2 [Stigmatopora nigra]
MDDDVLTTLKLLIIGESGVGKSSLLLRFTEDTFDPEQSATIGHSWTGKVSYTNTQLLSWRPGSHTWMTMKWTEMKALNLLGNTQCFLLRQVQRLKMAYSVLLRSLWRRSSKLLAYGKVKARARRYILGITTEEAAGLVEDTAQYLESSQNKTKKSLIKIVKSPEWHGRLIM